MGTTDHLGRPEWRIELRASYALWGEVMLYCTCQIKPHKRTVRDIINVLVNCYGPVLLFPITTTERRSHVCESPRFLQSSLASSLGLDVTCLMCPASETIIILDSIRWVAVPSWDFCFHSYKNESFYVDHRTDPGTVLSWSGIPIPIYIEFTTHNRTA